MVDGRISCSQGKSRQYPLNRERLGKETRGATGRNNKVCGIGRKSRLHPGAKGPSRCKLGSIGKNLW